MSGSLRRAIRNDRISIAALFLAGMRYSLPTKTAGTLAQTSDIAKLGSREAPTPEANRRLPRYGVRRTLHLVSRSFSLPDRGAPVL